MARFARKRTLITLAAAMAALAVVACGSEGAAAIVPTPAPIVAPTTAPTATPAPTPTPVPVSTGPAVIVQPDVSVAPGSDQEIVIALMERQATAARNEDWGAYKSDCMPEAQDRMSDEQIGATFVASLSTLGGTTPGYTQRVTSIKIYGGETAIVGADIYDGETEVASGLSNTYEKFDGRWHYIGATCLGMIIYS